MKTLYIDTHFKDIRIVLLIDGKVVNKEEVINKKNNSEYIFPTIIKVIDKVKIDEIIVVNGPGSFTGVRLGVTIAKTFAYTLNIPIYTVSSLECLMVSSKENTVGIYDNNGTFVGKFREDGTLVEDYTYIEGEMLSNISYPDTYDYEAIYNFVKKNKLKENPHSVKPIYVKKIGVQK